MPELVRVAVRDTTATVTLDNPDKMGALSVAAMRQLTAALKDIDQQPDIHVVILASEGKCFQPVTT